MIRKLRFLAVPLVLLGLVAAGGPAFAQSKSNGQAQKQQKGDNSSKEKKAHKNMSGKDLLGDKIKQNGTHKIHENGKFSTFVNVSNGKIAGVNVKNADKGDVPVTKYKTNKDMAQGPASGVQFASLVYAQSQYVGTLWIGYAYTDDYGYEYIYWFPYYMILDGDSGAVDYVPGY
jgi:hypothetical protein